LSSGLPNKKGQKSPPLPGSRAFLAFDIVDTTDFVETGYLLFMSRSKFNLGNSYAFVKHYSYRICHGGLKNQ